MRNSRIPGKKLQCDADFNKFHHDLNVIEVIKEKIIHKSKIKFDFLRI